MVVVLRLAGPHRYLFPVLSGQSATRGRDPVAGWSRGAWWALGSVVGLGVVAPLVLAVGSGSIAVPHNDAWAYSKIAQDFATTGSLDLLGWNRGAMVGQILPLGPLARSITAQQVAVSIVAAVALVMVARLVARRTTPAWGVLTAAVVAVFPGFGLLATSFMTDVPAFAAVIGCLLLGEQALERRSWSILAGAVLVGMWGFTIREQAVAAPVAVILAAGWQLRSAPRALAALGSALVVVVGMLLGFEAWRGSLPHGDPLTIDWWPALWQHLLVKTYLTLALLLSPVVATAMFTSPHQTRRWLSVSFVGAVELVVLWVRPATRAFLGNYLEAAGSYSGAGTGTDVVLPAGLMDPLLVVAVVSGAMLPVVVWEGIRSMRSILAVFTAFTVLGTIGQVVVGQGAYDRYLLMLVVPLAVACWRPTPSAMWTRTTAGMVLGLVAVVSLGLTGNGLSRDGATWDAAQALVRSGVPATDIDAGFVWTGYQSATRMVPGPASPLQPGLMAYFADSRACYRVSRSWDGVGEILSTVTYRTYGVVGSSVLTVSRTGLCP